MLSYRIRNSFLPIQILPYSMQTKNKLSLDFNQLCYPKSHQISLSNKKEKEEEFSHKTNKANKVKNASIRASDGTYINNTMNN